MLYLELEVFIEQLNRIGLHVIDAGLLGSALERPRTKVFGQDAYQGFELKAAALIESIIQNHALMDGNKRSSWFALNYFAMLNGRVVEATAEEAFEFIPAIAAKAVSLEDSAAWIAAHNFKFEV